MAVYQEGRYVDRIAGADLSTGRHRIVVQQADTTNPTGRSVILANSPTQNFYGVLNNAPAAGGVADVCVRNADGTFKVVVGAVAVALGDALTSDANGAAVTTTTAGNSIIGFAEQPGAPGSIIEYAPRFGKV